jgi:plastocyanin
MYKFLTVVRVNPGLPGFTLVFCMFLLLSCAKSITVPSVQTQPIVHVVEIKKFQFNPKTLTVRSGDTVRWVNKDIVPHQVAEGTLKKWRSKELLPNDSFTLKIKGSTSYICKLHPTMEAKIVVATAL